jgi:signal transduction histidine kinase
MLAGLAVELVARLPDLRRLIDRIELVSNVPRVALGREVLLSPELLQLPTAVAIEVHLGLLLSFANARDASLWTRWSGSDLTHIGHLGDLPAETRHTRELARKIISGKRVENRRDGSVFAVLVERWQQPAAALIVRGKATALSDRILLLEAAVPLLTAVLERDDLLGRRGRAEEAVVAATERRLSRLRFDLHDGPQQDLVLLADDLRLFGSQLASIVDDHPAKSRLLGRVQDLQSRLVALDGDLRRISQAVQSPFLKRGSLPESLAQITDAFAARTGIEPTTRLRGDFSKLSDSQQITLLGVIREALSNVREHSDAEQVTIGLSADGNGVRASIRDDGCGFEPETTLIKAAREGHLGLVGMHERVRLLGGHTHIDSRSGGPTVISVSLPAGPPAAPALE